MTDCKRRVFRTRLCLRHYFSRPPKKRERKLPIEAGEAERVDFFRATRGECTTRPGPCDATACRYHLHDPRKKHMTPVPGDMCSLRLSHLGPMTLDEVGLRMGITRERVRQVEMTALSKLKAGLAERGWRVRDVEALLSALGDINARERDG